MAQKGKKRNLDAEEKEDEMVNQMKASLINLNVEGNDELNADVLIVCSIQSKKLKFKRHWVRFQHWRKSKISKEIY